MVRKSLTWLGTAIGPLAWLAAMIAYFSVVSTWILANPGGSAALLLALPPILGEIAFTRVFEVPQRGWSRVLIGLAGRLTFVLFLAYLFVWLPLRSPGSGYLWFAQDLSTAPLFGRIVWVATPALGVVFGVLCLIPYLLVTVRRRHGRLTTTVILPALATVILFIVMYQFPDAAIRSFGKTRPDFVTRVWTPRGREYRFPRWVVVSADETQAVATFGSTFPLDSADPPPNDLDLGPRCDPDGQNPGECRRNLALIDLRNDTFRAWTMPLTRKFHSDSDRFFVAPWNTAALVELRLDGSVRKHPFADVIDGMRLRESNMAYHASDIGRVYLTYENNPVVVVWDVEAGAVHKVLTLAGSHGIRMGDSTLGITRSRSHHRFYVMVKSDPYVIVEIDEATLEPIRVIRPAPDATDLQLSPDERSLYMSSFFSGRVWHYDVETLTMKATLDAPIQCRKVVFSPDGSQLFAASYLTGELAVYDTRSDTQVDLFFVAPRLEGMHVAGSGLYILSAEGLYRVPLAVLQDRARARLGGQLHAPG